VTVVPQDKSRLPPWRSETERGRDAMTRFIIAALDDIDYDETTALMERGGRARRDGDFSALVEHAKRSGDVGRLRLLLPHLADLIHPPKLGRGQRYPRERDVNRHTDRVDLAARDVARICAIWREHYGRGYRREHPTAVEIAAERWEVSAGEVRRKLKKIPAKK
jgi:hypothetical protein